MTEPRIEIFPQTRLIGQKTRMSLVDNRTRELWQSFRSRQAEIQGVAGPELYSIEQYPSDYHQHFNPQREYVKWAAIRVDEGSEAPDGMEVLHIPAGKYAVFHYKGLPSQASSTYQYIYGSWVPQSDFALDHRPHFAIMGDKYLGEHPDSEEDLWIPIT